MDRSGHPASGCSSPHLSHARVLGRAKRSLRAGCSAPSSACVHSGTAPLAPLSRVGLRVTCGTSCPCSSTFPDITFYHCSRALRELTPGLRKPIRSAVSSASPFLEFLGSDQLRPVSLLDRVSRSEGDSFIKTSLDYKLSRSLLSVSVPSWSLVEPLPPGHSNWANRTHLNILLHS